MASASATTSPPTTTTTPIPPDAGGDGEPDPGRETVCPADIAAKAEANGTLARLAEKLAAPLDVIRHGARQFELYWTIGKGAGERRTAWMAKLRQWLVEQHGKGALTAQPTATEEAPRKPPERVRTYLDVQADERRAEAAAAARRAAQQ